MDIKKVIVMASTALTVLAFQGCGNSAELTVGEGFDNPLGFYDATPRFSWTLPEGVQKQTSYRVIVTDVQTGKDVWDSGEVKSDQTTLIPYGGKLLASRQQLSWRVRYTDQDGKDSDWSEPATFELGLLSANDWNAKWIRPADPAANSAADFKLIKAFYRSIEHPEQGRDVTELLRSKVHEGKLSVNVTNDELGGDPVPDEVKELKITYQANGKETTRVMRENSTEVFSPTENGERVACLRRPFTVGKKITQARLYVTARGLFEMRLNGEKVSSDHFANGWTSYSNRIDTLTYDVTDQIAQGDNVIGGLLGYGWYAGRLCWGNKMGLFGPRPQLLAQLEIRYADGTTETIVTDDKWKATLDGPIVVSSIYDGETYDARKEMPGWDKPGFDDSQWAAAAAEADLGTARLVPKPFAPVRMTETLRTQTITEPQPGKFVFDLGQNMVGWAKVNIPVEKDQTVTIHFAEMLNKDGTIYNANYRKAKSTDYYTAATTGTVEWEPVFTFHGFRYVELSGLPEGVTPQESWVTGQVLHSDLERIGTFTSSHAKLNQLQSNIVWGQRGNFVDIPTDCPQRDERLGWTGDAQVFCPASMFNYDCHAFWKSWLGSMRDDQLDDGRIPHVIPSVIDAGSPGWMDAATIIPWQVYLRTGDTEILADNFEMMEKLVGWYRKQSAGHHIEKIGGFCDWLQPYAKTNKGDTPAPLIGNAFYAHSTQILADSAKVLGRSDAYKKYAAEAKVVKAAFAKQYFTAAGKLKNAPETQTAYLLAIAFELIPQKMVDKAAANLVRLVNEADGHLRTGFLGTPFINSVLDETGRSDLATGVLFKETYPSWFFSINQGATTMWERWNSYSHADGFGNVGMNSFNHYAYGAINQWMVERLAGLAPDPARPGYKHIIVRPLIAEQLTSARAELQTPYGTAASGWTKNGDTVKLTVTIPPNTTATVTLPNGMKRETVNPGTHTFTCMVK